MRFESMVLLCFSVLFLPNIALASPIDCTKLQSSIEKTICVNPELVGFDQKMSNLYSNLITNGGPGLGYRKGRAYIKNTQRAWIKNRNTCIQEEDIQSCVSKKYTDRVFVLQVISTYQNRAYGDTDEMKKTKSQCENGQRMYEIRGCASYFRYSRAEALRVDLAYLNDVFNQQVSAQKAWQSSVDEICYSLHRGEKSSGSIGNYEEDSCYAEALYNRREMLSYLLLSNSR